MRRALIAVLMVAGVARPARAEGESLQEFLHAVETATIVPAVMRADGQIDVTSPGKGSRDQIAVVVRPPTDIYIEIRAAGIKALLLGDGSKAFRLLAGTGTVQEFPAAASLMDSDFTREDLQPFQVARFKDMRISDDSGDEITVTFFPAASQYTLLVTTFDRAKHVPIKTIYYKDTLNNAVKMQRDGDYVRVGGQWLPTTISMESFRLHTRTTLSLHWRQDPSLPPELFDPAFLSHPSPLAWPAAAGKP